MLRSSLIVRSIAFTGITIAASTRPSAWAVTMYGADVQNPTGGTSIVVFDSGNPAGTIHSIGHTGISGYSISGLDFDRTGTLYASTQVNGQGVGSGGLCTIDQTNGHATLVGAFNIPSDRVMTDLTYNPASDTFMGVAFDNVNNWLYNIDKTTGAASLVGQLNSPGSIFLGICADSAGTVYLEDYFGSRMRIVNGTNVTTMSSTIGAPVLFSQGMTMDWSNDGKWYLAATWERIPGSFQAAGDVRVINNSTGGTQQILGTWPQLPSNGYPVYGIADTAIKPTVPEPMISLLAAPMVCSTILKRRARSVHDCASSVVRDRRA
ncbi:hypothetical protein BH09PLA1_BH09PLA1_29820 [soil metagenome]